MQVGEQYRSMQLVLQPWTCRSVPNLWRESRMQEGGRHTLIRREEKKEQEEQWPEGLQEQKTLVHAQAPGNAYRSRQLAPKGRSTCRV